MAKAPPSLLAWASYVLMFSSAFILLGGTSASQRFCGRSEANSPEVSGVAAYFGPTSCDKLYSYTWFITWYQIAMIIIVPVVLGMGKVHTWRYGLIGILIPITYLLMATANSFFLQAHAISSNKSSSRTVLAGSIIGAIANFFLIILFGIRDERFKEVEA